MKKYSSYKDSGIAWIGQIPSHWNTNKIGAHFTERKEKVSDKDYAPLSVTKLGILPQLEDAAKTENGDNRKLVLKGDFVVNSRSDRKSSCGVSTYDGSVSLINIILKPRNINQDYIHYLFRSNDYVEEFYRNGRGIVADLWTTRYSEMKNIFIPIPPVDEQEAIVRYITEKSEKIDRYIAEQERLLAALDELRAAEIARAVTRGLNPDAPLRDSGIDWIGQIPDGWKVQKLKYHYSFEKGKEAAKYTKDYVGLNKGPYPVYSGQTENHGVLGNIDTYDYDLLECLFTTTVGAKAMTPKYLSGKFSLSQNCLIMHRTTDMTVCKFVYYCLFPLFGFERKIISDIMQPSLRMEDLRKFFIPLPSLSEQQAIVEYLDEKTAKIDRMKADIEKQISLLKEYNQRMISDAVTGKIDVRE